LQLALSSNLVSSLNVFMALSAFPPWPPSPMFYQQTPFLRHVKYIQRYCMLEDYWLSKKSEISRA